MSTQEPMDRRRIAQQSEHMTRPPRLEGIAHRRGIKPVRKPKKGK